MTTSKQEASERQAADLMDYHVHAAKLGEALLEALDRAGGKERPRQVDTSSEEDAGRSLIMAEIKKLQLQMHDLIEGISAPKPVIRVTIPPELDYLVDKFPRLKWSIDDPAESDLASVASKANETEDGVRQHEINEVVREALKLINSNGLDSPEAHLEYVRQQLRAAVA